MIVVFGGPSLHGANGRLLEGFEVRPPAVCGDILKAVNDGADVIGLIDGVFESVPSVWHKEILLALSHGIAVLGSSSMGALRAAECGGFGMIGIGEIFEDYAKGRRTSDADVAVIHAPAELGFQPLSLALVDAEYTLKEARKTGVITIEEHAMALASAQSLRFKDRTWGALIEKAYPDKRQARSVLDRLTSAHRSLKSLDAEELLRQLKSGRFSRLGCSKFGFNRTHYFDHLSEALSKQ